MRGAARRRTRRRGGASLTATAPSSPTGTRSLAAMGSSCCMCLCLLKLLGGDDRLALPVLRSGSRREVATDAGAGLPGLAPSAESGDRALGRAGLASSVHAWPNARPQWRQPRSAISLASPERVTTRGLHTAVCARTPHRPDTGYRGEHEGGVHHSTTHFNLHYTRCGPRMTDVARPLGKTVNAGVTFGRVSGRRAPAPVTGRARPGAAAATLAARVPPRRRPSPPCAEPPPG